MRRFFEPGLHYCDKILQAGLNCVVKCFIMILTQLEGEYLGMDEVGDMITLRDLLNMPNLAELVIIAGEAGIDKEIKTVITLDAPDSPKWLKGNELAMTSAYIFEENTQKIESFVRELIQVGASGLAFKMGRHLKQVPATVLELANRNAFPIITIPQKLVWTDVIATFYDLKYKINNNDNIIRIEPHIVNQVFLASKWGSKQLLAKLTELFQIPIIIAKRDKKIIAENNVSGTDRIKLILSQRDIFIENCGNDIINIDNSFLIIRQLPISQNVEKDYIAMIVPNEHVASELSDLLKLLVKVSGVNDLASKGHQELYRELLLGIVSGKITEEEIKNFALNRKYDNSACSCIFVISSEDWLEIYENLQSELQIMQTEKKVLVASYIFYDENNNEAVVLIELFKGDKENAGILLRDLMGRIKERLSQHPNNSIAVGGVDNRLELIKESYYQACEAKRIGRILWEDQTIFFYNNLSFYSMLSKLDLSRLDLSDVLLIERNKKHLTFDGIATLEVYLECGNFKKAASKLYVHENTLRYRVQKISELLKLNFENPLVAHNIIIKIKLWKLLNKKLPLS